MQMEEKIMANNESSIGTVGKNSDRQGHTEWIRTNVLLPWQ
jgi:hypothetical protein